MFVYLSKKIAIPHNIKLQAVSWNSEQGWIACGGANGLLKVLKLESKKGKKKTKDLPSADDQKDSSGASGNLSMNQTLDGHNGSVCVVTWNENYRKLTTSDQYGLIIVWMLHKGMWFEEMINNRNKSVVRDMKWTADGQKICIVYEDGAVIVGSVDGNRLWGKELDTELSFVEWSHDGRNILFGTAQGEVHLYDNLGNFIAKLPIFVSSASSSGRLIGIHWFHGNGVVDPHFPSLAIGYDNGKIQIMRDESDEQPILIDTGMNAYKLRWNTNGTILAITGTKYGASTSADKETQMVQFYNPFGKHLRTLKVPGSGISSISWEGGSLRLGLAVDSFIYFANIRPDYEWGFFSNTLVYSFNKSDRPENCVVFWDLHTDERHIKYVKQLVSIKASGEHCVFATKPEDNSGQFILILCNAIGSPVDSKYIEIEPIYITMTPFHVIVASNDNVYVWQYRTLVSKLTSVSGASAASKFSNLAAANLGNKKKEGRERLFHIDDPPQMQAESELKIGATFNKNPSSDPICAMTASKNTLVIARASGTLLRYSLPHLSLDNKYLVRLRPQLMSLNCDSTRLSIIDINGVLTLFDMEGRQTNSSTGMKQMNQQGVQLDFERKDVWDMIWSEDNPELFACMEKTRMYVFRNLYPEEPVMSNAYLCAFNDLCIRAVQLDDIMNDPEHPDKESIVNFETKSLRDTRELLATTPISEAFSFIETNPHPRLWRILAESALEQLNFIVADKAFVKCQDYQGIQFVKRLQVLNDRNKQRAEVAAYFRRFDEAENIYLSMDNKDLAIELRMRLGDWFRVVQLIQQGGGDDSLLNQAFNSIGDYYSDRQKWSKALRFYSKSKNYKMMIECSYILDDFQQLEKIVEHLPNGSDLLKSLGDKFSSVGLCSEAVQCFLKADDAKAAIDACVLLNQWDLAVSLAEKHKFPQIEGLLTKYASHLMQKEKQFQAIELYRKANKHAEAAKLLIEMAQQNSKNGKLQALTAKKMFVMAAQEVDKFKQKAFDLANLSTKSSNAGATAAAQTTTMATLQTLLDHDSMTSEKGLEDAWHGAEAFHFLLLAHRQLSSSQYESALKTALRLTDYEDVLDVKEIYSLIALTAFYSRSFEKCSRAFIKLESADNFTKEEKEHYKNLALSIFIPNSPLDTSSSSLNKPFPCPNSGKCDAQVFEWMTQCAECGKHLSACIASGRALLPTASSEVYTCKACKHRAYERDIRKFQFCPLCHTPLR